MLPIVQRELRVTARSRKLYLWRLRFGIVQVLVAVVLLISTGGSVRAPGGFFRLLSGVALLFCLLEGIRKTADAISEEKRDGTLGLLFLTDLRGADIVLGKLAAAAIRSLNGLLAFLPVLAITLLLGGTTGGEFARMGLLLIAALLLSLCTCLFASSVSRKKSAGLSIGLLVLFCFGPLVAGNIAGIWKWGINPSYFHSFSPIFLFQASDDSGFTLAPVEFWTGLAEMMLISILLIAAASFILPRTWRDNPGRRSVRMKSRSAENLEIARQKRQALLDRNPVLWLTYNQRQQRTFFWAFAIVAGCGLLATIFAFAADLAGTAILGVTGFILYLVVFVQLASQSSMCLAEARRNGTLDLLLTTPVTIEQIVHGHWLALRKTFAPAALVLGGFSLCFFIGTVYFSSRSFGAALLVLKPLVELFIEYFVLGWVGMWMGLTSKTPNRAFFRTMVVGLFLPYFFCAFALIIQIVLLVIAPRRVRTHFRQFVAERYQQHSMFVLAAAQRFRAGTPPVIR
jgi:ABC-type transport system involved in multi-copper enzyme maturation permease subunit